MVRPDPPDRSTAEGLGRGSRPNPFAAAAAAPSSKVGVESRPSSSSEPGMARLSTGAESWEKPSSTDRSSYARGRRPGNAYTMSIV